MAEKKDTTLRCAKPECKRPIRLICENPGPNGRLKPKFEHNADLDTYEDKGVEIFFLDASYLARSTFYKLRRELAARCQYEAKS
jgi:hypothetical protein